MSKKPTPRGGANLTVFGPDGNTGRWTDDEQNAFLKALKLYGHDWKKIATMVRDNRTALTRSNAGLPLADPVQNTDANPHSRAKVLQEASKARATTDNHGMFRLAPRRLRSLTAAVD